MIRIARPDLAKPPGAGVTLQRVPYPLTHVPAKHPYTMFPHHPITHSVSLYPTHGPIPPSATLLPNVSLFPVSYLPEHHYPRSATMDVPVPASLRHSVATITSRQEEFRQGFQNSGMMDSDQRDEDIDDPPPLVIKEELPEDLSVVSEKDVVILQSGKNTN